MTFVCDVMCYLLCIVCCCLAPYNVLSVAVSWAARSQRISILTKMRSVFSRPSEFVLSRKPGKTGLHENTSPFFAFLKLRNSNRHPCPACSAAGIGHNTACPFGQDEVRVLQSLLHCILEKQWVTTDLGSSHKLPFWAQAPVQDIAAEAHSLVHLYFHVFIFPRHRPFLHFFKGQTYQYKVLTVRPSLFPPYLLQGRGRCTCPVRGGGHSDSQLTHEICVRPQGLGAQAPQPSGGLGQLGKEQTVLCAEHLFSHYGAGISYRWTAWISFRGKKLQFHWRNFRDSSGIWHLQKWRCHLNWCIWDRFSTDCTAESQNGHGAVSGGARMFS